jgi:hypothetical protein
MDKKLILVGVESTKEAYRHMSEIMQGLRSAGAPYIKVHSEHAFRFETRYVEVRFIFDPAHQHLEGLRADAIYTYGRVDPDILFPYAKPSTLRVNRVGIVDWIMCFEKECENYIDTDIAMTSRAASARLAELAKTAANALSRAVRRDAPLTIKKVHFSGPVTVVVWSDGTLTKVRCQEGDTLDYEKGLALAIAKRVLGTNKNRSDYYDVFKKYLPEKTPIAKELKSNGVRGLKFTDKKMVVYGDTVGTIAFTSSKEDVEAIEKLIDVYVEGKYNG